MNAKIIYLLIRYFIACVWLLNGLFCKVLNFVPRHQEIVGRILGNQYAEILTKMIGVAEIFMAIWILSGIQRKLNAATQILIVTSMNILEFILVPDVLLWGKFNAVFAFLFVCTVFFNEFLIHKSSNLPIKNV